MLFYDIANGRIRLRQPTGDQFEFAIVAGADRQFLRMSRPPHWADGIQPKDAEIRLYLAHASARGIAQRAGIDVKGS